MAHVEELAPLYLVRSVPETIEFYTAHLGFEIGFVGEPARFTILKGPNRVTLMFRQLPEGQHPLPNHSQYVWHGNRDAPAPYNWDYYYWVKGVDAYYDQLKAAGVPIIRGLEDTEYGNRDFEIMDPNGYVLCLGESLEEIHASTPKS